MVIVLGCYKVRGQPLYRQWSDNKTRLYWFTREVEKLPSGSWKLRRYVTLGTVKLDRRQTSARIMEQADKAEAEVLKLPGVKRVR